jgi:uncharacterized membrane protein
MSDNDQRLLRLLDKLDKLEKKQLSFQSEVNEIREEIRRLQQTATIVTQGESDQVNLPNSGQTGEQNAGSLTERLMAEELSKKSSWYARYVRDDLEKFIGENLINKIGILITIIGVAIGARYAIDHDLISPAMRIILGYGLGGALLLFAIRLRDPMPKFSAVLFSGAMAVFYIITYSAYHFYDLIPLMPAYLLMVLITVLTVAASVSYNRQVVAHIGLVGAYAVPFLVGGEGSVNTLFLYMAVINSGVLAVSIYKYWKPLTISAFVFTWLIFGTWFGTDYNTADHFATALGYSFVFFLIIYLAALYWKLSREEQFGQADIWLILANSFVFYAYGYAALSGHETGNTWIGAFTIGNALIHLAAAIFIYRSAYADKNLLWLVAGLGITFFTIAIPVELEGNWITLLWTAEAALLFGIGRTKEILFYIKMSQPVLALAFISLIIDWNSAYPLYQMEREGGGFTLLFNIHFFTSLFFVIGLAYIIRKDKQGDKLMSVFGKESDDKLIRQLKWVILAIAVYFTFLFEIMAFFNSLYIDSKIAGDGGSAQFMTGNRDMLQFGTIWSYNYTMLFLSLLAAASVRWLKNKDFSLVLFVGVVICTVVFFENGLSAMGILKQHYLDPALNKPFEAGMFHIGVRYTSFLILGGMLWATGYMARQEYNQNSLLVIFDALLFISILWVLSNELMLWMDIADAGQPYKLGLSILWGIYALAIIALGIRQNKKHLRIGAIILLGITLVKLFFYDIVHLDAIARTILLIILGLLLLLASYLYNKFRMEME